MHNPRIPNPHIPNPHILNPHIPNPHIPNLRPGQREGDARYMDAAGPIILLPVLLRDSRSRDSDPEAHKRRRPMGKVQFCMRLRMPANACERLRMPAYACVYLVTTPCMDMVYEHGIWTLYNHSQRNAIAITAPPSPISGRHLDVRAGET